MHVWLIQTGEPLPSDPGAPRLLRTGLLAAELVRRGHRVTWWASTFRHSSKTQRADRDVEVPVADNYRLLLLHSPGYSSNVSLRRLVDHRILGRRWREWAQREAPPQLIQTGFPTIETAYEAVRYAQQRRLPCVIDARDMWPDIYVDAVPRPLRPLVRVALGADFRMTRSAFRHANAITAHAPGFVDWGLRYAGRARSPLDRDFPFAYPVAAPGAAAIEAAEKFWRELGVSGAPEQFVVCFFGTFAARREVDIETVLQAARQLASVPQLKLVLCGAGPAAGHYAALAKDLGNLVMPGWVDFPQIWTLMRRSRAGLLPYLPSPDFLASMPNKSIEYLSAGLPIVTSLQGGYLERVLRAAGCGFFYEGGNAGSLAATIRDLMRDAAGLARSSATAAALFERDYRQDAVYARMAEHLESVCAASSTGGARNERGPA
jgi:glycosyltransferase involved in cell wall biosynthesis